MFSPARSLQCQFLDLSFLLQRTWHPAAAAAGFTQYLSKCLVQKPGVLLVVPAGFSRCQVSVPSFCNVFFLWETWPSPAAAAAAPSAAATPTRASGSIGIG